jgi:hypothetical protein
MENFTLIVGSPYHFLEVADMILTPEASCCDYLFDFLQFHTIHFNVVLNPSVRNIPSDMLMKLLCNCHKISSEYKESRLEVVPSSRG